MGTPRDLPTMHAGLDILQPRRHITTHRTNDCSTPVRHQIVVGLSGIIAGAGGVTHAPGMVAGGHDTSTRHWCNLSRCRHCPE
jgi:phosphoribosylcarboxyaminoimidazole (NCAIR) mutase